MSKGFKFVSAIVILIALLGGVFVWGIYLGYGERPAAKKITSLFNKESAVAAQIDFGPFWQAWNIINEKSPSAGKIKDQDRVWFSIKGLVSSLRDPYSVFFDPEEAKIFEENISGKFGGVGIEIGVQDGVLTVIAPLKDAPAYRVGVRSGDKIVKINGDSTIDLNIDEAVQLIRGEKDTRVVLTIFREGEEDAREVEIVRDIIKIPTIETELVSEEIFVIRLFGFSADSPDLFQNAMREFTQTGAAKLILDLRGNPGGYFDAAINIASWFLPAGKVVAIEDFGGLAEEKVHRSRGYNILDGNLELVILVDKGSASGSEILAGALSEHEVAKLVGESTFGKGSVQELIDVTEDTSLKITIAEWLTPGGISISKEGLKPDYEVKITEKDLEAERDPQMDKAVELLK